MEERSTALGEATLRYGVAGEGNARAVCLIPGWGGNRHLLYPLASALGSDYKLIFAEMPGFYGSQIDPPFSMEQLVASIEAILAAESVDELLIGGHSMGGAVALAFAARHPGRVSRVVGIDCFTYLGVYPAQPEEAIAGLGAAVGDDYEAGKAVLLDMFCNEHTAESAVPLIRETLDAVDIAVGMPLLETCMRWDMMADLAAYPGPVSALVATDFYDAAGFVELVGERVQVECIDRCSHFNRSGPPRRVGGPTGGRAGLLTRRDRALEAPAPQAPAG